MSKQLLPEAHTEEYVNVQEITATPLKDLAVFQSASDWLGEETHGAPLKKGSSPAVGRDTRDKRNGSQI